MRDPAIDADHLPPASLPHARSLRDDLARLLARERASAAEFLVALADFDARRGWEPLGHAGLFAFLHRELGLSKGAAYLRFAGARLLPRHPEVAEALRLGRLCLSAVGELSRVLTPENSAEVLPRFYGCSAREAREVAAALVPREDAPRRELVTRLPLVSTPRPAASAPPTGKRDEPPGAVPADTAPEARPTGAAAAPVAGSSEGAPSDRAEPDSGLLRVAPATASSARARELAPTHPVQGWAQPEVEPLDGDLRRLHLTVSRRLLSKLAAAREGLARARPAATTEQVLEVALDLLLQKQARAKRLTGPRRRSDRPQDGSACGAGGAPAGACQEPSQGRPPAQGPEGARAITHRRPEGRRAIPADVERAVRLRDGGRCQFPLDAGGTCGSTVRVELDHVTPVALGGRATVENLRLLCARHNRYAARLALGEAMAASRGRPGRRRKPG
jgi:HNH endonuclease